MLLVWTARSATAAGPEGSRQEFLQLTLDLGLLHLYSIEVLLIVTKIFTREAKMGGLTCAGLSVDTLTEDPPAGGLDLDSVLPASGEAFHPTSGFTKGQRAVCHQAAAVVQELQDVAVGNAASLLPAHL